MFKVMKKKTITAKWAVQVNELQTINLKKELGEDFTGSEISGVDVTSN